MLIKSFTVDHLKLRPGLYVSRVDGTVTTFDLRFTAPNVQPPVDMPALHTIEHLGATYFRSGPIAADVVYFGPMGCRTGFYLLLFGDRTPEDVLPHAVGMCDYILSFEGEIPGARPEQCGNCLEQNLPLAKYYAARYKEALLTERNFTYP